MYSLGMLCVSLSVRGYIHILEFLENYCVYNYNFIYELSYITYLDMHEINKEEDTDREYRTIVHICMYVLHFLAV